MAAPAVHLRRLRPRRGCGSPPPRRCRRCPAGAGRAGRARRWWSRRPLSGRAVLNLGGIANVTLLAPGPPARGFDTGPANVFLDAWCQRHLGQPYDADGRWAATGQVVAPLLEQLIASEPWFALPPPKSTGRDRFNLQWLDDRLAAA
ncbi:hypothetical protein G6F50_015705 [Rhizopus delemar]|uniref:Anhydro-N-acetylmuramic acid kinase n=1 Tax=Rhizopus delemar TaxID=936053 RepID=A0A9P6XWV1_9FUNG|nr:hypothetical protein G6F50_015705 [Rhizopus delemar]